MRKQLILTLAAAVLLMAVPAKADPATAVFASGAIADWVSTYQLLNAPAVRVGDIEWHPAEGNPLIGWADSKPAAMVLMGAGIDIAGVLAWNRLTRNHPTLRKVGLVAAGAARFGFAYRNYKLMEKFKKGVH